MRRVKILTLFLISTAIGLVIFQPAVAAQVKTNQGAAQPKSPQLVVQGTVYCLDESGRRLNADQDCSKAPHLYEIVSVDKKLYRFSPDDVLTAMFKESRVRKMTLQISGLLHPPDKIEIASLQAIHEGKLYDIFYYCEICSITAYGPGDCPCCYNPLEFREKPALENH